MKETLTKHKGVYTRQTTNGISFIIDYYDCKVKKREVVGTSQNGMTSFKAHKIREERIHKIKERKELSKSSHIKKSVYDVGVMTLNEVFDKYYKIKRHNTSIHRSYESKIRNTELGTAMIKDINDTHRTLLINKYRDINKSTTIEHLLAILKAIFNLLIQEDLYVGRNIFKLTKESRKELPKQQMRTRMCSFTVEELNLIRTTLDTIKSCNKEEYSMLLEIMISTGARVATILNLQLDDIVITNKADNVKLRNIQGVVTLKETKTETNVTGYIIDKKTISIIEDLKLTRKKSEKLFTISYETAQRFFKSKIFDKLFNDKLDKSSNDYAYKKKSLHCIRHTFGTLLVYEKVNIKTIMSLMGHKRITTTEKYLKTDKKVENDSIIDLMSYINGTIETHTKFLKIKE